jgi:hypothetical protein
MLRRGLIKHSCLTLSYAADARSSAHVDKGYRGTALPIHVEYSSGQKRGVFGIIKRELRRRSAIEAVIGHMRAMATSAAAI